MAKVELLTVIILCVVYTWKDDVFITVTPILEPISFNSKKKPQAQYLGSSHINFQFSQTLIDPTFFQQLDKQMHRGSADTSNKRQF